MNALKLLFLSNADVAACGVTMPEIIEALRRAYAEKGHGRYEMPPKPGIHTRPNALIHAMPAYLPASGAAGMKWVSAYPENPSKGLPQVAGLIELNDEATGLPLCVMDCRWVTAKRTGAKTAVAAEFFARSGACQVGIIGCGVQGRSNLEALACVLPISGVRAYDVDADASERYAQEMAASLGVRVRVAASLEEAVQGMDVVVTSGPISKEPTPTIPLAWVKAGAFLAPVDFDSYWMPEVWAGADLFCTDDARQFAYYREVGYFRTAPPPDRVLDLGAVAIGKAPRRTSDAQRVVAMNLGSALDDMAVAPLVFAGAKSRGLGTWLEL